MKVKLDENLPVGLNLGDNVDTVQDEGLCGASDDDIWVAAQQEGRMLITQDLDFSDIRRYAPGEHFGLVLIRLSNPSRSSLSARLRELFHSEDLDSWKGAFVVVTDWKIRVRLPQ
jgi:predicted nuclease of predicted toxin-antitoxin system